ncbi:MAG: hypothetical protein LBF86_05290 [Helicobacteraceae bacterium]|nr:hypothetical protein [Helicobacteraceae bacterium]
MSSGFETLKTMNVNEMYRQTRISVAELQAILSKRFENFNRAKALGFFRILEREYNLDLSDLVAEYEAFYGAKEENNQIFVVAKEEKNHIGKYLIVVLALIAIALGWAFAKFAVELPQSAERTAAAPAPIENAQNPLIERAMQTIDEPEPTETLAPIIVEPIETEQSQIAQVLEFYVIPEGDLWIQTNYLDTGEQEQKTISARYDFDSTREADFLFGHGRFKLVCGTTVMEPQSNIRQRVRFKDGDISPILITQPRNAPITEQNDTETN